MAGDIRNYLFAQDENKGNIRSSKQAREFKISEIFEKKNGFINPVIVTFQNGELNEHQASKCVVSFYSNEKGNTNIEVKTCGHIFKDSGFDVKPQQNKVLVIKNRLSNKVKLVEVDHSVLINSALLCISQPTAPLESNNDVGTKVSSLNRTFGAKKVMNRLIQKDKLCLGDLPVADEVKKTVKDIKVEDDSFNMTETDSILHLLPPCHRNSQMLSTVYRIDEILTEIELEALREEVDKMMEKNFISKEFSPLVVSCFSEIKNSQENVKTKLAGILFVETLIKFLKMPSKKLAVKKLVLCSFSTLIHNKILNEFCIKTDTSITRPLAMRDKSLCYIIALCLICCNYRINLKLLATSTLINFNRLSRLAQVVGAVPLSKGDEVFVLKLPLPALPKAKAKGKMKIK